MMLIRIAILFLILAARQTGMATAIDLRFIDDATFPADKKVEGTPFNGLSAIHYDEVGDFYVMVSDDRSEYDHARVYSARISVDRGLQVRVDSMTYLKNASTEYYPTNTVDFEGIVVLANSNLLISDEGNAGRGIGPKLREFGRDGSLVKDWPVLEDFQPDKKRNLGIRNNLGLESLTITPDKRFVFTANEQALRQDGEPADRNSGTPVRIVKYDGNGHVISQFRYMVDPFPELEGGAPLNGGTGLVELLALDECNLLALERSYIRTSGRHYSHLYHVVLPGGRDIPTATAISDMASVEKRLLLDFDTILPLLDKDYSVLDNIEGMCMGPPLDKDSRLLLFVSDGNFNTEQRTQFLAFQMHTDGVVGNHRLSPLIPSVHSRN